MVRLLEPIKEKFPILTYADLYQLAGVVAIEVTGGPEIPFHPGREDTSRSDQDFVALSGDHTLGRCHKEPSGFEGVRQEAAGALWNLYFDDKNREAIALVGGLEALVVLAHSCSNASQGLQERLAGALSGLSISKANSIVIGRGGGVAPLIALTRLILKMFIRLLPGHLKSCF
ncbi:hypothetical protein ZIOFF_030672 [Zingiber officinale]|uniref:Plant heme peroxidase family profile domain-containing protein n=1 Tax=Zingiber officinale TaxID=94328 RepID=A0A8J5LFC7_ZINOF|nr:hypothetical protein ZIOFF_030672 [Zingiber officinale]